LPVEVYKNDLIRLGLTDDFEYSDSPKKVAKSLVKQKIVKSFNIKSGVFILEQNAFEECLYLGKDKKCTVYKKRPDTCRNHPEIGPRPGYCGYVKKS
jgi:Fe-S-cluster containining protein